MSSPSFLALAFLLLIGFISYGSFGQEWNYSDLGPDVWLDLFPGCQGSEQSPVNIRTRKTKYKKFSPFKLSSEYFRNKKFKLKNEGHGITATLVDTQQPFLSVTGGGLQGTFKFVNFHLHWGQNYASGSEHRVDGKKYAADFHIVHQNLVTQKLAVLGFLIESVRDDDMDDDTNSKLLQPFFDQGSQLTTVNQSVVVEINLGELIESYLKEFWRYPGSLTVPPCSEGVTWSLFINPIRIPDRFIDKLRKKILSLNSREPQPLGSRRIYRNFNPPTSRYSSNYY